MSPVLGGNPNSFEQTMLGLEYDDDDSATVDLFSRACVEEYGACDVDQFGYLFAQVFEDGVLEEVALRAEVPYADVASLAYRPTPTIAGLAELADEYERLPVVRQVNVAAALVSVSRFGRAQRILAAAARAASGAREAFEVAMLDFVVANRRDNKPASTSAFARMRAAIESGSLPSDRVLDACAQGVVWFLKRRDLAEEDFAWFRDTGVALAASPDAVDPAALSSWYRALAMVPAAQGEAAQTRDYMERARAAAAATLSRRPRAYEMHLMKTYYESSLKEHMYVTRDRDAAVDAAQRLIALDPAWAPSYGELAEAYERFGDIAAAAESFERAAATGPPYVRHHLFQAARCRERIGDDDAALAHYVVLAEIGGAGAEVLTVARDVAQRCGGSSAEVFDAALRELA